MIRCDVCGTTREPDDKRRWTSKVCHVTDAVMRCPDCAQREADDRREQQRKGEFEEQPRGSWWRNGS